MDQKISLERVTEAVDRAHRHWQAQKEAEGGPRPTPPRVTVAISHEAGSNAPVVARTLGERLGWPVYDRELLQRIAAEMGVRATLLESVDERRKGWLLECLEALGTPPAVSQGGYVRHLVETLLALAAHGDCVVVGRGAAQVLPAATTLRVRLVGPVEDRRTSVRQRFGIEPEAAARWVAQTDAERVRFVKDHFHKDPTDPHLYDLVLNTSRLSAPACAEIIIETLRRLQARAPVRGPEAVKV
jgi:cytidylate kinase